MLAGGRERLWHVSQQASSLADRLCADRHRPAIAGLGLCRGGVLDRPDPADRCGEHIALAGAIPVALGEAGGGCEVRIVLTFGGP